MKITGTQPALLFLLIFACGAPQTCAQTDAAPQSAAATPSAAPSPKILTKDPEYLNLLDPPLGNDFLQTYSSGYRQKSDEIEAGIAGISDENLRIQARDNEWARVLKKDRDAFSREAETSFNDAKVVFLRNHKDGWFEVGSVSYDENNNTLVVNATPSAPAQANFRVAMNRATIGQVYDKFHQVASQEIDQKAREYVSSAGAGSICARNADLCLKLEREDIERSLRSQRIVVVAQGNIADRKVDRLLLVDYQTETILMEMGPENTAVSNAAWRFTVGLLPVDMTEADPAETQPKPVIAASQEAGPSANETAAAGATQTAGESSPGSPESANLPPARISVPGKVEAASIIAQTKPLYPLQARAHQVQGDVVLHAIIDKLGKISEVQVLSGDDTLAESALQAVRQWRYRPRLYNGEPVEVDTTITVTFSLLD